MPNHPLFYPVNDQLRTTNLKEQIQIALAIADSNSLRSLLTDAIPPLINWSHIGTISTELAVPTDHQEAADAVLHFEVIKCILVEPQRLVEQSIPPAGWKRELTRLTRHASEMQTLGQNLSLAATVGLLKNSGFCSKQIEEILRLPQDAWHKSWWYSLDAEGQFTIPFLRYIRTLHYPNGTLTLQYKDFFEQDKPLCFTSLPQKSLIAIRSETQGFGETLRQINYQRQALGITHVILICDRLSELEAQGFISQGISVYPAAELVLPMQANCHHCVRCECPMNGIASSPVALCYGFLPDYASQRHLS